MVHTPMNKIPVEEEDWVEGLEEESTRLLVLNVEDTRHMNVHSMQASEEEMKAKRESQM